MCSSDLYLRCNEVLKVQLEGLQERPYEDYLNKTNGQQWGDVLTFVGAIDRIYQHVTQPLVLRELGRRTRIAMSGFEDVVVWNPGDDGVQQLADMPDEDWRRMLCVEAAQIAHPVTLPPGEEWTGMQTLSV